MSTTDTSEKYAITKQTPLDLFVDMAKSTLKINEKILTHFFSILNTRI